MSKKKTNEEFLKELEEKGRFDIQPLEEYKTSKEKILFKCLKDENHPNWYASPSHILHGEGCPCCSRNVEINQEEYEKRLKEHNIPMHIVGEYYGFRKQITLQCDQEHIWNLTDASMAFQNNRKGCPFCNGDLVYNKNSIATKRPELVKYFKNKKQAFSITTGQKDKIIKCKCPYCKKDFELTVLQLTKNKHKCPFCSEGGISRPNKLLWSLLLEVRNQCEDVKREYQPNWAKPYSYDGYFKINGIDYLVEMHGEQHYKPIFGIDFEDQLFRDKEKIRLAKENNHVLIIIECINTDWDYMIQHVLESQINKVLNLSKIDWKVIKKQCCSNLVKRVSDLYNGGMTTKQIAEKEIVENHTVVKYLKEGARIGLNNYVAIPRSIQRSKKIKLINVVTEEEIVFVSLNALVNYMHQIGFNIDRHTVKDYEKGWYYSYYKGKKKKVIIDYDYHGYKFKYIE